eukprot:5921904-Alexandrium_andersonii.AAC.1
MQLRAAQAAQATAMPLGLLWMRAPPGASQARCWAACGRGRSRGQRRPRCRWAPCGRGRRWGLRRRS